VRRAALAFLAGVLLVQQLAELPSLWWLVAVVPFLLLALDRPVWLIGVFFVCGVAWASFRAEAILAEQLAPALEGADLVVTGYVADIPQPVDYGERFVFDIDTAQRDGRDVSVPRRVSLSVRGSAVTPRAGERWRFSVRLTRPHGLQNPGGFDYEAHLLRNRIRARGYVRDPPSAQRVEGASPRYAIDRARQYLGERIHVLLEGVPTAGIVVALANGDARGLSEPQWQTLRATGTLHLVAISGLHISLIAGIAFFLAKRGWAWWGRTVLRLPAPVFAAVFALLAASGYAALAGFVIPTQRALIMLTVAMGGIVLRRRYPPSQLLAGALLAVLLYDPLAVLAPGFWLSYAAVAVIVFAMHGATGSRRLWQQWSYLQWAIALGMLPLSLWLFQQVSLVAPLANMLAVPVFDLLAVPLTLLGLATFALPFDAPAQWQLHAAAWSLAQLWHFLEWLAAFDYAQWSQPRPPLWAALGALVGIAWLLAPRGVPARWVGALWLVPLALVPTPGPAPGELWFTLLDVGQGLAAVVRTQDHVLVYDTGPRAGAAFDAGAAVVVPYLRAQGIRRIDTLVVSHGDNDHIGGAASILRTIPVARVLSSVPHELPGASACAAGQEWRWDGVVFRVLGPPPGAFGRHNDASCVLHVAGAYGSVLLPGDIEMRAERELIARGRQDLASDILVAPHHGSLSSSSCAFIDAVAPRYVFFPVGYRNRHHHPHPRVLARYERAGVRRSDSASAGALETHIGARGVDVHAYRERARRYWFSR
jgi:competence protein ComEC